MSSFLITAPDGRKLKISGESMPTEQELDEIFEATGTSQSVMDDRDQKVYNVPVTYDGVDTTYAIDTQHNGADKDNYFGKVAMIEGNSDAVINNYVQSLKNSKSLMANIMQPFAEKVAETGQALKNATHPLDSIKRGFEETRGMFQDMVTTPYVKSKFEIEQKAQQIKSGEKSWWSVWNPFAGQTQEEQRAVALEVKKFRDALAQVHNERYEAILPSEEMNTADKAVASLSNSLSQSTSSVALTWMTGNPKVAAAGMAALYGAARKEDVWEKAMEKDYPAPVANTLSYLSAAWEAGVEYLGDSMMLKFANIAPVKNLVNKTLIKAATKLAEKASVKGASDAVKVASKHLESWVGNAAKGYVSEFSEEFLQGIGGDLLTNAYGLTDIDLWESAKQATLEGLSAGFAGGTYGAIGTATHNRLARKVNNRLKETVLKANPEVKPEEAQIIADGLQEVFYQGDAAAYLGELNKLVEKQANLLKMPENNKDITKETVKMLKEKYQMSDEEIEKTVQIGVNMIDMRNQFAQAYNYMRDELELEGINANMADKGARLAAARLTAFARDEGIKVEDILKERALKVQKMRFVDFMAGKSNDPKSIELSREDYVRLKNFNDKKAPKDKRMSLVDFIKYKGGLKDAGGELQAMDAQKQVKGLVNNKDGIGFDDMTQMAWDAGYFEGTERPEINQLLEAIRDELFGNKRYAVDQEKAAQEIEDLKATQDMLASIGVDLSKDDWGVVNEKIRQAQKDSEEMRATREYNALNEDNQERYAILRDNGMSHDQAMATINDNGEFIAFQMAGPKAKTAALDELDKAKQLESNGVDNEKIRQETGWFKGVDGKWRFEISDKDAEVNRQVLDDISSIENLRAERKQLLSDIEAFKKERENNNDAYPEGYLDDLIAKRYDKIEKIDYDIDHGYVSSAKTTLGELLDHEKLYTAYPSLRYMPVTIRTSDNLSGGAYSRSDNTIYLDSRLSDDEIKSVLMHEIQHVIQDKENFSRGGNMDLAKSYRKIIKTKEAKDFHKALERKITEAMTEQLQSDNLTSESAKEVAEAYGKYLNAIFDDSLKGEEVTKIEKGYYQLLEKLGISPEIVESAYKAIQDRDLWQEAVNETKSKLSDADAYDIYRAFAGEVEARNTQARMNMTDEERKATPPEETQDVKNADALVVMPDGTEAAYNPNSYYQPRIANIDDNIAMRSDKSKYLTDNEVKEVEADARNFVNKINAMEKGELPKREQIVVLRKLPSAYSKIKELKGKKLLITQDIYKKIGTLPNKYEKNHNIDRSRTIKLPELVADPNYILQSTAKGHEDRFVIVTKSRGKKPSERLSVIVQPENNTAIVSGYDEIIDISEEKKAGRVLFDKKKELETMSSALNAEDVPNSYDSNISPSKENVKGKKTWWQSAWHGGRELEGGKFSLKYAGKQVGLAHGYGVYASANVAPATGYRSMIDENITYKGKNIAEVERELRKIKENDKANLVLDFAYKQNREELDKEDYSQETWTWFENEFLPNVKSKGKLYEVDVPEDAQLIEEKKPFSEQTDTIKEAIKKLNNEDVNDILDDETTGEDIYGELVNYYSKQVKADDLESKTNEAQKLASQALEKVGIKGIAYYDNTDGRCFVIFNPDDVKVIQKFYQGDENNMAQPPRGAFTDNVLYLFENADASTIIHELGHYFLEDLRKYGKSDKSQEQLQAIYDYLGVKDGVISREQHEYFADSFEVYLKEGKAPNSILRDVFNKFKNWLSSIISEVKRLEGVKLTDEMRKTFDEMLGGKSLDYTLQISGQRMMDNARSGYISPATAQLAVDMLKQGKMSRAELDDIIERMRSGELARSDVYKELKAIEAKGEQHNEQLNPFDTVKYREALLKDNVNKAKVLEKIKKLMEWTAPRTVNGKLVGRFPDKRMNDFFAEANRLMTLDKEEARRQMAENKAVIGAIEALRDDLPFVEREKVLGMDINTNDRIGLRNALVLENRMLSVADKSITPESAIKLYGDLLDSYNSGRLTANVTAELKRKRKQEMIATAKDILTGNGAINTKVEKSMWKQALNRLGTSQMSWGGLMDILSMNDSSKVGQSKLSQMMDVFQEEQKQAQGVADDGERFCRFFEKKLGGPNNEAITVSKYINNALDKKTKLAWGAHQRTFTKDELIDIWMKAKDADTREIMLNDPVNEYNEEFLRLVEQELNADDRAFADALFEFYNDNWAKINEAYEEHYGISMPKNDYYSPRSIIREGISVSDGSPAFAGSGFTKGRTARAGASVDIKGAFKVWNNYVVETNRWLAWSDKLMDINSVFGNSEIKKIIENQFGSNMNSRIKGEVERMAGAKGDKFAAAFSSKLMTKIRSNYAKSVLALKPALMIKQLTSFPAYWNEMSFVDFTTGLADFFKHPKEAIEILGNTTLMKTRGTDIIRDFAEISKMDILKGKKGIKWSDAIMLNIRLGDRGAIYMGGWALYKAELKKNLAQGMSEEEAKALALERFERVTDETQQSGRLSQQSYWQSNPALRMFTMFMSSQNQYLRKEIGAVRGLATGRMDKGQALKTLFIFHVLLPCLFQFASDGFDWDKEAQLRAGVLGSLNGMFVLANILTKIYDATINRVVFDVKPKYGSGQLAVREIVPFWASVEDLAKEFEKLAEGDVDLSDVARAFYDFDELRDGAGGKALSKITKATGEITGLPLKYPLDVIRNFGNYAEDDKYRKEILLYLGWSPYALKEKDTKIELLDF